MTIRTIQAVVIDRSDGSQTTLRATDDVFAPGRGRIALSAVPDALATCEWIDYDTDALFDDGREREAWEPEAEETYWKARSRLYSRNVVECMVVYDEPVDG